MIPNDDAIILIWGADGRKYYYNYGKSVFDKGRGGGRPIFEGPFSTYQRKSYPCRYVYNRCHKFIYTKNIRKIINDLIYNKRVRSQFINQK